MAGQEYDYLRELAAAYCGRETTCPACTERAKWDMDAARDNGFKMVPLNARVIPGVVERPGSMAGVYEQE